MKLPLALARALRDHDVDVMFGVISDSNLFMVDAFVHDLGGTYVSSANEAGATLMACGYASASGRVGVATVTQGPGLTNAMTGLAEGTRNRVPMVMVVGDTPVEHREHLQNAPHRDLVLATGAGFEQVASARTAVRDVAVAFRRAQLEHRPVVVNVPVDLAAEEIDYEPVDLDPVGDQAIAPDLDSLDRAVGLIATARRPVVLAGRGAIEPGARAALLRLAERIGAPVATTLKGKDLFRHEPFDLGIFGTLSTPLAVEVILESDCVLAFGAGLNEWTASKGTLLDRKRVVHCDLERSRLGAVSPIDVGIVGDARAVADAIVGCLDEAEVAPSSFRTPAMSERLVGYSPLDERDPKAGETLDLLSVLAVLDDVVPPERVLVTDGGRYVHDVWRGIHVQAPRSFVYSTSFGAIGLGMGYAIGAAVAAPGRPVLLTCGDGGFMLGGLAEFNTAVRHGLDLIVVVFNDGSYASESVKFRERDMDPGMSYFDWPDLAPLADVLGGRGITVRSLADLDGLGQVIGARDRPLLVDVKISRDLYDR